VTLENDVAVTSSVDNGDKSTSHTITDDWKYPFVVHSPAGVVEVRNMGAQWMRRFIFNLPLPFLSLFMH